MAFLLFIPSYLLSVLIHETGHVCAALLVGWKPISLKIGKGRDHILFRIGDLSFKLGNNPFGGMAVTLAPNASHFRWKRMFVAGSGSLANIIVALLILGSLNDAEWFSRLPDWLHQMSICTLVFCLLSIRNILIPRHLNMDGKIVPNDARTILSMLTMKDEEVKRDAGRHIDALFNFYLRQNRLVDAEALLSGSPQTFGSTLDGKTIWIHALLYTGRTEEARAEIDALLKDGFPPATHAEVLDGIACISFYYGHPELYGDSMRYIDQAIAEAPNMITLKGTKGALLVETGRLDEGIAMLEGVLSTSSATLDKAISEYYLALAFCRKGDSQQSRKHFAAALALAPECQVRGRIEEEIRGGKTIDGD